MWYAGEINGAAPANKPAVKLTTKTRKRHQQQRHF